MIYCLFVTSNLQADTLVDFKKVSIDEVRNQGKKVLVSFSAKWCLPCQFMDENIYSDAEIAELINKNFIAIKADLDSEIGNDWNELYNANYLPTTLCTLENGQEIDRLNDMPSREEFLNFINRILTEYKAVHEEAKAGFLKYEEAQPIIEKKIIATSNFTIQVGAFSTMNNALKISTKLNNAGIHNVAILEEHQSSGKLFYKVRLNGYSSKSEAEIELNAIKQKGFEGFVKKI